MSSREIIQETMPLDRQWRQIDPSTLTKAGEALVAKHPEINTSSLSPENRRGLVSDQWKSLKDRYNREIKIRKNGLQHDFHASTKAS